MAGEGDLPQPGRAPDEPEGAGGDGAESVRPHDPPGLLPSRTAGVVLHEGGGTPACGLREDLPDPDALPHLDACPAGLLQEGGVQSEAGDTESGGHRLREGPRGLHALARAEDPAPEDPGPQALHELEEPESPERPHGSGVQALRTRFGAGEAGPVQEPHVPAGPGEEEGGHASRGPAAHHEDVGGPGRGASVCLTHGLRTPSRGRFHPGASPADP